MILYADTSYLLSLYLLDANSSIAAADARSRSDLLVVSVLAELEFFAGAGSRKFHAEITAQQLQAATTAFAADFGQSLLRSSPVADLFNRGLALARQYCATDNCRTLDILHLAFALSEKADVLLSFDQRQRSLALKLGLQIGP